MIVYLEMIGEGKFAISFQGFFSHELKDAIKQVPGAKYDNDNKVWVLPQPQKPVLIEKIRKMCVEMEVKIVDVPLWVKEYYQNPIPYSLTYNLKYIPPEQWHDYRNEARSRNDDKRLDKLPEMMLKNLY